MVVTVIELNESQREKLREELEVDPPPTLLICADTKENLKKELENFFVSEKNILVALAE